MDWQIVALVVYSVAALAFLVGAVLLIGVLGGQWALQRQIIEARDAAELANSRITRETKARAGREGVEARQEAKSLAVQAAEHLAAAGSSYTTPEPLSTLSMINGGGK